MTVAQHPPVVHTSALVLVKNPKRNRYVGGIKQFTRQNDNRLHLVVLNELLANGNGIVVAERTIGKQEAGNTIVSLEFGEYMENPCIISIALGWSSIIRPVHTLLSNVFGKPMLEVERRICHNIVKGKSDMPVLVKS